MRTTLLIILTVILSTIFTIFSVEVLFPKLATVQPFSNLRLFHNARENVTVIEKTEQVTVREDGSVNAVAAQAATSVVSVASLPAEGPLAAQVVPTVGPGTILTSDGIIVTHRDVITAANARYQVTTFDGRAMDAQLVSTDPFTDLVFLRVESTDLPAMPLANSDDATAGKKLVAIGNTALPRTVRYATGVLSFYDKTQNLFDVAVGSSEQVEGLFALDFNALQSYHGAPMIDFNGEMVGVIIAPATAEGRQVVLPSNHVRDALGRIVQEPLQERATLGLSYVSLTPQSVLRNANLPSQGALITAPATGLRPAVVPASPAAQAGLQSGDVIVRVDDQEVTLDAPLANILAAHTRGDALTLTILRGGAEQTVRVEL